jgi:quinol monooxygenase YgiN
MIEVHLVYHIKPDIDQAAYFEWMKKAIIPALTSKGIIEVRAQRNIKETHKVLVVGLWETLEDWTVFAQSEGWQSLISTLQNTFATNLRIEVWGQSPVIPQPLRPYK